MIKPNTDLASLLAAAITLIHAPETDTAEVVTIGEATFRLIADQHHTGSWIVVLLQESEDRLCSERLKKQFGLTAREIEVTRLLADRFSNREIADHLGVTVYTAGRHTERVLQKLGVSTRRDVRRKLLTS